MGKSRTYLNDILERRNKDQFLNSNDGGPNRLQPRIRVPPFSRVFKAKTGMSLDQFRKVG